MILQGDYWVLTRFDIDNESMELIYDQKWLELTNNLHVPSVKFYAGDQVLRPR
jgi:hypothetical protein